MKLIRVGCRRIGLLICPGIIVLLGLHIAHFAEPLLATLRPDRQDRPIQYRSTVAATPEALTFVAVDPVPDTIPTIRLAGMDDGDPSFHKQAGTLIMARWVEENEPIERGVPPNLEWPTSLPLPSTKMALVLETNSAPFIVNISLWTRVDEAGLPVGSPTQIDCELDGDPAACRIVKREDRNQVHVHFDLPAAGTRYYVAVYAAWVVDPSLTTPTVVDWPVYEAGWLFRIQGAQAQE